MITNIFLLALAICLPFSTLAQHNHVAQSPYAGMQNRALDFASRHRATELRGCAEPGSKKADIWREPTKKCL